MDMTEATLEIQTLRLVIEKLRAENNYLRRTIHKADGSSINALKRAGDNAWHDQDANL